MIKVNIVCMGKMKEDYYRQAVAEYGKRLSRFCRVEIKEFAEGKNLKEEAVTILKTCQGYKIALCVEGKKFSSEQFAAKIKQLCDEGKEITFIIGSSEGLDDSVKNAADLKISFSDMTFPHRLMRVILTEQIYRAFMINEGSEYHK